MMQPQFQEAQGSSPSVSPPRLPSPFLFPLSPSPQLGQQQLPDTADQELPSGSSLQGAGPARSRAQISHRPPEGTGALLGTAAAITSVRGVGQTAEFCFGGGGWWLLMWS